jgi:hypothetical protein
MNAVGRGSAMLSVSSCLPRLARVFTGDLLLDRCNAVYVHDGPVRSNVLSGSGQTGNVRVSRQDPSAGLGSPCRRTRSNQRLLRLCQRVLRRCHGRQTHRRHSPQEEVQEGARRSHLRPEEDAEESHRPGTRLAEGLGELHRFHSPEEWRPPSESPGGGWGGVDAMSAENAAVLIMHMSMYRPRIAQRSRHDPLCLATLVLLPEEQYRE